MRVGASRAPHEALGLSHDDLRAMYGAMLTARLVDEASFRLNRQGKAPFVVPVSGHEGCQVATAWPLRPGVDWWFPYYRDLAVVLVAGMTPYEIFLGLFAKADDPSSGGRQMPAHWGAKALNVVSHSSPISTQISQAAGVAYAAMLRGEDTVTVSWFGDGATSEGGWHEGLNFAGIHRLPVIFVCENNQYAISVGQEKQMAVKDVADRAAGYGFPGVVVDGNAQVKQDDGAVSRGKATGIFIGASLANRSGAAAPGTSKVLIWIISLSDILICGRTDC